MEVEVTVAVEAAVITVEDSAEVGAVCAREVALAAAVTTWVAVVITVEDSVEAGAVYAREAALTEVVNVQEAASAEAVNAQEVALAEAITSVSRNNDRVLPNSISAANSRILAGPHIADISSTAG